MSPNEDILAGKANELQISRPLSPPTTPPREKRNEHKVRALNESKENPCSPKTQHDALPSPPASPLSHISKSSTKDRTLSEHKRQRRVSQLRTKLGLDYWECGAERNDVEEACRCKIGFYPKGIRYSELAINTQIESVIDCSRLPSPKPLWEELYRLTRLVHCQHHNFHERRLSRVHEWRDLFGRKESVKEQILKTLQNYDPTCDTTNEDRTRCSFRTMGWRVANRSKTMDIILKPETYLDDKRLEYFLRVLKICMLCDGCISSQRHGSIEIWKGKIQKILEENIGDKGSTAQPIAGIPVRNPIDYWPHEFENSLFDVIEDIKSGTHSSLCDGIYEVLNSKIEKESRKPGYVYAFEDEANPGFVKIGYTIRGPEDRRKEWEDDCNRNFLALYPLSLNRKMVPKAHRVEELCHAELKHRNTKIYCHCCLKPHIEWFKVTPDEAIAVIEKWSKWIQTEPYTKSGTLKKSAKPDNISQFVKGLSAI